MDILYILRRLMDTTEDLPGEIKPIGNLQDILNGTQINQRNPRIILSKLWGPIWKSYSISESEQICFIKKKIYWYKERKLHLESLVKNIHVISMCEFLGNLAIIIKEGILILDSKTLEKINFLPYNWISTNLLSTSFKKKLFILDTWIEGSWIHIYNENLILEFSMSIPISSGKYIFVYKEVLFIISSYSLSTWTSTFQYNRFDVMFDCSPSQIGIYQPNKFFIFDKNVCTIHKFSKNKLNFLLNFKKCSTREDMIKLLSFEMSNGFLYELDIQDEELYKNINLLPALRAYVKKFGGGLSGKDKILKFWNWWWGGLSSVDFINSKVNFKLCSEAIEEFGYNELIKRINKEFPFELYSLKWPFHGAHLSLQIAMSGRKELILPSSTNQSIAGLLLRISLDPKLISKLLKKFKNQDFPNISYKVEKNGFKSFKNEPGKEYLIINNSKIQIIDSIIDFQNQENQNENFLISSFPSHNSFSPFKLISTIAGQYISTEIARGNYLPLLTFLDDGYDLESLLYPSFHLLNNPTIPIIKKFSKLLTSSLIPNECKILLLPSFINVNHNIDLLPTLIKSIPELNKNSQFYLTLVQTILIRIQNTFISPYTELRNSTFSQLLNISPIFTLVKSSYITFHFIRFLNRLTDIEQFPKNDPKIISIIIDALKYGAFRTQILAINILQKILPSCNPNIKIDDSSTTIFEFLIEIIGSTIVCRNLEYSSIKSYFNKGILPYLTIHQNREFLEARKKGLKLRKMQLKYAPSTPYNKKLIKKILIAIDWLNSKNKHPFLVCSDFQLFPSLGFPDNVLDNLPTNWICSSKGWITNKIPKGIRVYYYEVIVNKNPKFKAGYCSETNNYFLKSSGLIKNEIRICPKFLPGDVMGCGIYNKTVFFTRNGIHYGTAYHGIDDVKGFISSPGEPLSTNFGNNQFIFDLSLFLQRIERREFRINPDKFLGGYIASTISDRILEMIFHKPIWKKKIEKFINQTHNDLIKYSASIGILSGPSESFSVGTPVKIDFDEEGFKSNEFGIIIDFLPGQETCKVLIDKSIKIVNISKLTLNYKLIKFKGSPKLLKSIEIPSISLKDDLNFLSLSCVVNQNDLFSIKELINFSLNESSLPYIQSIKIYESLRYRLLSSSLRLISYLQRTIRRHKPESIPKKRKISEDSSESESSRRSRRRKEKKKKKFSHKHSASLDIQVPRIMENGVLWDNWDVEIKIGKRLFIIEGPLKHYSGLVISTEPNPVLLRIYKESGVLVEEWIPLEYTRPFELVQYHDKQEPLPLETLHYIDIKKLKKLAHKASISLFSVKSRKILENFQDSNRILNLNLNQEIELFRIAVMSDFSHETFNLRKIILKNLLKNLENNSKLANLIVNDLINLLKNLRPRALVPITSPQIHIPNMTSGLIIYRKSHAIRGSVPKPIKIIGSHYYILGEFNSHYKLFLLPTLRLNPTIKHEEFAIELIKWILKIPRNLIKPFYTQIVSTELLESFESLPVHFDSQEVILNALNAIGIPGNLYNQMIQRFIEERKQTLWGFHSTLLKKLVEFCSTIPERKIPNNPKWFKEFINFKKILEENNGKSSFEEEEEKEKESFKILENNGKFSSFKIKFNDIPLGNNWNAEILSYPSCRNLFIEPLPIEPIKNGIRIYYTDKHNEEEEASSLNEYISFLLLKFFPLIDSNSFIQNSISNLIFNSKNLFLFKYKVALLKRFTFSIGDNKNKPINIGSLKKIDGYKAGLRIMNFDINGKIEWDFKNIEFLEGLNEIIPEKLWKLFNENELKRLGNFN